MRVVLYDVRWQVLRMSCLERYHPRGGWATVEGTRDNLVRLEKYLIDTNDPREYAVRQFRVNNCLVGALHVYSKNDVGEPRLLVEEFRRQNTTGYDVARVRDAALAWDWRPVVMALISLRAQDEALYIKLHANVCLRRRKPSNVISRAELDQFLMLVDKFLPPLPPSLTK